MKLGEVVLHLHQVLLNSDEKQKRFKLLYKTYLMDTDTVRPLEAGELGLKLFLMKLVLKWNPYTYL